MKRIIKNKLLEIGKITCKDNLLNVDREHIGLLIKDVVRLEKQEPIKEEIKWLKNYIGKSCGIYSAVRIDIIQERIKELSKQLKELK